MRTAVHATVRVPGLHQWAGARVAAPDVGYLGFEHRHLFTIVATKWVTQADRQVEFILLGRDVRTYIERAFPRAVDGSLQFGGRSCEMLAREILDALDLDRCEVWEDDENGASIERGA